MNFLIAKSSKFRDSSEIKNIPCHSRSYNPKVQIFPIDNDYVMKFLKMFLLFLLGTVFLIRTASEKMFLIRTDHVKYIEKQNFLLNGLFLCLNLKISFRVRIEKCSLTDGTLTSSGWSQTGLSYRTLSTINVSVQ
jgi:hypothetical protein